MLAKKIVVSESPELLAVLETSFFHREGFRFLPVHSSDMLYRLVESEAPAMAILDLAALGAAGPECCRCIKRDPLLGKTPLMVLLPREGGESLAAECHQSGCDALLPRPLEPLQLLDAACALLGISQRLARRVPVDFPVVYATDGGKKRTGRMMNLNADGMFFSAEKLYPVGTMLLLDFVLPAQAESLSCKGQVAWVNHPEWRKKSLMPSGMGIRFEMSSPYFIDVLNAFLAGTATDH